MPDIAKIMIRISKVLTAVKERLGISEEKRTYVTGQEDQMRMYSKGYEITSSIPDAYAKFENLYIEAEDAGAVGKTGVVSSIWLSKEIRVAKKACLKGESEMCRRRDRLAQMKYLIPKEIMGG